MKNKFSKALMSGMIALVLALGLSVSAFAGASSGSYYGTLGVGFAAMPCSLSIGADRADASIALDGTYQDFSLGVTINGTYRSSTNSGFKTTSNGNNAYGRGVSTSISNLGGTWIDVYASYAAYRNENYNGSITLP